MPLCASSLCSNLDTPVITVPEWGVVLLPLIVLVPVVVMRLRNRPTATIRPAIPNPIPRQDVHRRNGDS